MPGQATFQVLFQRVLWFCCHPLIRYISGLGFIYDCFRASKRTRDKMFFSRSLGHVYVLCPLPAFSDFGKMQHWHCHPQRSGFTPGLCPEECHLGAFGDDLNRSQVLMKQTAAISCLHGIHGLPIQPGWPCCFALGFRKGDESAGAERWKHRSLRNGEGPQHGEHWQWILLWVAKFAKEYD